MRIIGVDGNIIGWYLPVSLKEKMELKANESKTDKSKSKTKAIKLIKKKEII